MSKTRLINIIIILVIIFNIIAIFVNRVEASEIKKYTQYVKSGIEAFPESYRSYLTKLKEAHPNWNFEAYYTGISWNELVEKETVLGKNRVIKTADSLWINSAGSVESGYACASDAIIKYYMDPRNFLKNDVLVFQFLEMTYNSKIQTKDGVVSILSNTFMNGSVNVEGRGEVSYAQIIMEAAQASNMSPYSIAIKILQEVGTSGSQSVSGTYPGYEGYYNFFNYGANDEGNAIINGLEYAKNHGWNSQYISIVEGAKLLADNYTNAGQNTAYFYKWDVVGNSVLTAGNSITVTSDNLFNHQYMTNVQDPVGQASRLYNTYLSSNILDCSLNFVIPVYEDMGALNKLPTRLTEADGALYYSVGTGVYVRSGPSTSYNSIGMINSLDEVVAVQARKTATDNTGMEWDKVKLSNGIVGYVASKYLKPCSDNETGDVLEPIIATATVKLSEGSLRMRSIASTSGVLVTTIENGAKVDILQKDIAEADGYTWYKIRYNGYTGYVAKEYLTNITNIDGSEEKPEDKPTTNIKAEIKDKNIISVPKLTVGELAKELGIAQYAVTKDGKAIDAVANVGTGYLFKDLTTQKEYTIIVKGDVNGDGSTDALDALKILKYDVEATKLEGVYLKAADVNNDENADALDALKILKFDVGSTNINL